MIQKEESVRNLFRKLIARLRGKRSGLNISFPNEPRTSGTNAPPTCPLCGVVPLNWDVHNKWCSVVVGTKSGEELWVGINGGVATDREPYPPKECVDRRTLKERLAGEQAKEQERLERLKWVKSPPDPEPIEGRTCTACGGKLVVEVLNYFWDRGTDHCAPADKKERCLGCGRETVVIASGPPCGWW